MRTRPALVLCGFFALVTACSAPDPHAGSAPESPRTTITVFAAASLKEAFTAMETDFERSNPQIDIVLELQGSQDIVTALNEGAPADVVATANLPTMKKIHSAQLVAEPRPFAANTLTLIVPRGNPAQITGLDSSLRGKKLITCAPEVPCGEATQRLAAELGIVLTPASEEQKVTDVRGKVASGEADAGIVYRSDALAERDSLEEIPLPGSERVKNIYPIALLKNSDSPELGEKWVQYVLSEPGQKTLEHYGFTSLSKNNVNQ